MEPTTEAEELALAPGTGRTYDCTHYVGDNLSWERFLGDFRPQYRAWMAEALTDTSLEADEATEVAVAYLYLVQEKSGASAHSVFQEAPPGSMAAVTLDHCRDLSSATGLLGGTQEMKDRAQWALDKARSSPAQALRNALYSCALVAEGRLEGKSVAEVFHQSDEETKPSQEKSRQVEILCPQYR